MVRTEVTDKLKFVKAAILEVKLLPEDQFSKLLLEELQQKQRELVGLLVQWTVDNAEK